MRIVLKSIVHPMMYGLLAKGSAVAGAILTEAGVDPTTLTSTPARGAHPGGTAAIGQVVDKNLETELYNLFVADASVFPKAPWSTPCSHNCSSCKKTWQISWK